MCVFCKIPNFTSFFFLLFLTSCTPALPSVESKNIAPARIENLKNKIFIDLGKVWFGNITIKPNKKNLDKTLTIRMGENRDADGIDRKPPGAVRVFETQIKVTGTFTPMLTDADKRKVKSIKEGALPFRYIEIEGWSGPFNQSNINITVLLSKYFKELGTTRFDGDSAAENLNSLMKLGAHTMAATSFAGVFVDGDRERLPYEADAYINQLGWYFVTGDEKLPRATFESLLEKPSWPSEWMSHLIFIAWEDYQQTGDIEYLKKHYEKLKQFSLIEFIDKNGLVNTQQQPLNKNFAQNTKADYLEDIVDWPPQERDGHEMLPYNTVVNSFVYEALSKLGRIAKIIGQESDFNTFQKQALSLKNSIQTHLQNPDGLYIDGLGSKHSSAHSLFIPLAFGLVKKENTPKTLAAIKKRIDYYKGGFPCSVYGAQYLLDALYKNNSDEMAFKLLINKTDRGWLNMLKKYDATITQEAWDKRYKENIDWTHAWGSAFLNVIPRHLVGIKNLSPGWKQWSIAPSFYLKSRVTLSVPIPQGIIDITINPATKTIRYRAPSNTTFVRSPETSNWDVGPL